MSAIYSQWHQSWLIGGYFTGASWCLNVWDGLLRLDDEVTFIWPMPWNAYVKWLYLFGKYFALAVQTVSFMIQLHVNPPLPLRFCWRFRAFAMIVATLIMFCFIALLIIRIYALYGRRTWSRRIATVAVLVESAAMLASLISTISVAVYDPACTFAPVPPSIIPYIVGSLISQGILLWLAFRKRERVVTRRLTIVCITIRDGIFAFTCISVFFVLVFICALDHSPVTSMMIYWLPVICSISICRIILNIQRTANVEPISEQFTTEVGGLDRSAGSYLLTIQSCSS